MIRVFARIYPNSFHLAFYACCREIFDVERHSGCLGGTYEQVQEKFKAIEMEQKEAEELTKSKAEEMDVLRKKIKDLEGRLSGVPLQD